MRFSRHAINTWVNSASLLIGAYIWIAGLLAIFMPHSPWVIGTVLGLLSFSTVGIIIATTLIGKIQCADDSRFRVFHRLGFARVDADPEDIGKELETRLPDAKRTLASDLLFRLGKDVCKDHNPSCNICPLTNYCTYAKNEKLIQVQS